MERRHLHPRPPTNETLPSTLGSPFKGPHRPDRFQEVRSQREPAFGITTKTRAPLRVPEPQGPWVALTLPRTAKKEKNLRNDSDPFNPPTPLSIPDAMHSSVCFQGQECRHPIQALLKERPARGRCTTCAPPFPCGQQAPTCPCGIA